MKKVLVALAALTVAGIGALALGYRWVNSEGEASGKPVSVRITPGSSGEEIAESLASEKVVDSALAFRIHMKLNGVGSELRAGDYRLRTQMAFAELVAALRKGPAVKFVKLVIPEGLNVEQTAQQVGKLTHIEPEQFLQAVNAMSVKPGILPQGTNSLEGVLYPATYYVTEKETADTLLKRLVREFEERLGEVEMERAAGLGRTPYEILIIASMIEEEAKADKERTNISAVIHNRLKKGIPLGIDATIQYAVKKYEGQPLTQSDLEIDSPYNSRKRVGLPPTPISSPRMGSISAALDPAAVDYLYYVLDSDCVHHVFTADYAVFERAKARQPRNC